MSIQLEDRNFEEIFDVETKKLNDILFSRLDSIKEGEIVKGNIIHIGKRDVIIDVGYKSEGVILKNEFKLVINEFLGFLSYCSDQNI